MPAVLSHEDVDRVPAAELPEWRREDDSIVRDVTSETFAGGIRLLDSVAVVADELDHHPDIDVRWTTATYRLSTHSAGGITQNDLELARRIDSLVAAVG